MSNFEQIREEGRLLMEFVRGSQLYGLNTATSDVDTGGIFIATSNEYLGFLNYLPEVSDERHDNTWYEIGRFIELICKSNPTALEALFVPENKIIGGIHPYMKLLRDNRDCFITKKCFNPFYGYARSQIEKARGLNKKIVRPVKEKLTPFDFIYTFKNQGSTKFKDWLNNRGLYQRFCGCVNIPNMHDVYGVYYDFSAHFAEFGTLDHKFLEFMNDYAYSIGISTPQLLQKPILNYRGVVDESSENGTIRLSSIDDKTDVAICNISYNQSGYTLHSKSYKEYKEWEKNRNPVRYESNLNKNYDSKNMMHCFRLIHMAKEIAQGQGFILERTWDKEFLLKIRNHEFEYDQLMELLEKEKSEMEDLMKKSTIPEDVDLEKANEMLIEIRTKDFLSNKIIL